MREILFRGKRIDNGEWVYGYYVKLYDPRHNRECHCIYTGYAESDCEDLFPDWYEVDRLFRGQYTGLIDKNGRKIFEGDILKGKFKNYAVWFDNNEKAYVYGSSYQGGYIHSFATYLSGDFKPLEVIGNVHDNPELLEEVSNNA